jgi:hypothetical protein
LPEARQGVAERNLLAPKTRFQVGHADALAQYFLERDLAIVECLLEQRHAFTQQTGPRLGCPGISLRRFGVAARK